MPPPIQLHVLFCSHVWGVYNIEKAGIALNRLGLIIELSVNSNMAPMLEQVGKPRAGVAGLLVPGARANKLAVEFSGIPAPLLLSAHPPVPVAAIANGVANLRHQDTVGRDLVILVNIADVLTLRPVYELGDTFRVLWDIADPPNHYLAELGDLVARHSIISSQSWHGVHFYEDERRRSVDPHGTTRKAYEAIISEYPGLQVAATA